jgi:hydroxyacylglutathione hydrolase
LEQQRMLFSGDHIMQGSTVVIAPPDGDMKSYLDALRRLKTLSIKSIAPGHGHVIEDPMAKVDEYLTHRGEREQAILHAVEDGADTVDDVVERVYVDVPDALHPIARHSVYAHLLKLGSEGKVRGADLDGHWSPVAR